jgi:S1-C subfamily serine protease
MRQEKYQMTSTATPPRINNAASPSYELTTGEEASPTIPLRPTTTEAPTSTPWANWPRGAELTTPPPYNGGYPPIIQQGGSDGRPRRTPYLALGLLAVLILGVILGLVVGRATASTGSSGKIVLGSSSSPNITISNSTASLQSDTEKVAAAVKNSIVEVISTGSSGEGIGSGDIISTDGYIVTNDHVVNGFSNFTVKLANGTSYTASLVGADPQDDLAVLKIAASNLTAIAFADSSTATVGQYVVAVGTPLGLQNTFTFGIVSATNRTASEAPSGPASTLVGLIQTSAQINNGNSGGALVNLSGQLLGIPTLAEVNTETGTTANGIGYAISSNRVEYVAQQLIQYGTLKSSNQGFLGIQGQDLTPQLAAANGLSVSSGVVITNFANDTAGASPAQQAGLQTGDVITAVNGNAIASSTDLSSYTLSATPGAKITVTYVRGSAQNTLTVTLGERPANS